MLCGYIVHSFLSWVLAMIVLVLILNFLIPTPATQKQLLETANTYMYIFTGYFILHALLVMKFTKPCKENEKMDFDRLKRKEFAT